MEQSDLDLINQYSEQDAELRGLYEEHIAFEKLLEKLENKPYLSPVETREVKEIKKKKLAGKTKIEAVLMKYRKN